MTGNSNGESTCVDHVQVCEEEIHINQGFLAPATHIRNWWVSGGHIFSPILHKRRTGPSVNLVRLDCRDTRDLDLHLTLMIAGPN